ncbi:accessory factor UbiK family protein [Sandarakinorhabdus sp.]|uniref:accessory factor UbiK family protein n=1 Tax=Sandarakinorhabdus sp. TaxID=1916663 RepID=UPI00286E4B40|nr:accessory factor UbiK family protein [Sandarakinorhabdus sp.]
MQTENKLFEDLSKVATAALGTLAGAGREFQDAARARARDFVAGGETIDIDAFETVKASAAAAREAVEVLRAEVAELRSEIAALRNEKAGKKAASGASPA